jgi:hypothetical protein
LTSKLQKRGFNVTKSIDNQTADSQTDYATADNPQSQPNKKFVRTTDGCSFVYPSPSLKENKITKNKSTEMFDICHDNCEIIVAIDSLKERSKFRAVCSIVRINSHIM